MSRMSVFNSPFLLGFEQFERTIDRIIFEKTSSILNSKIIVSQQENNEILNKIKKAINGNKSEKIIFKDHYNYVKSENNFIYYEDNKGTLKLEYPNILGDFQLANIFNAICTLRNIKKGEEITCDYGFSFDKEDYKQFPCKCGAKNCCGWIIREESRWRLSRKFSMSNKKKLINNSR